MTIYHNICPADCFASCRLLTKVQNGRIVEIKGDPKDPYTGGKLCAKGYAQLEKVYSPERILQPLKQLEKGSGKWEVISWEKALREIATILVRIKEEYGDLLPVCLSKYLGTMGLQSKSVEAFFHSLGPVTTILGTPCEATGMDALNLNYGSYKKPPPEDMVNSRLILIWGANPAWTAIHQMASILDAQENGSQIVVIDPVFTATAARSDHYFQIRPGTDGHLALGIAKILVSEDLLDHEFLNNYTTGWPKYRDFLKKVDLDEVASLTGIPLPKIHKLAHLYGTAKPATIWIGIGVQRGLTGGQSVRAIDALAALTGNIGKAGGNVHYLSYDQILQAGDHAQYHTPYQKIHPSHRHLGLDWYTRLDSLDPPLKFLWVAGRNPVSQDPDSTAVKEALKEIETVVVADQFLTSTAQMADYFLPVSSPFEHEDVIISFWHYGVGMNEKAIPPLGESRSDFAIMNGLVNILHELKPGLSTFPSLENEGEWLESQLSLEAYDMLGISDYRELAKSYSRIKLPSVPWQDYQFPTSSRKYEFYSRTAENLGLPPLPNPSPQVSSSSSYPFRLLVVRSYATLNSQFYNLQLPRSLLKKPFLLIHPQVGRLKNLREGDIVKIYNQMGEIEMYISFSLSIPQDLVVTWMGVVDRNGKEINSLVSFSETDLGEISFGSRGFAYNNCFVNLTRVG